MKYLISFLLAIQIISAQSVSAANQVAGALEPTQILNNIELIGVNISDASTAISTNLDMIKNTVLDPIANGLISNMLQRASNDIIAWANGGFEGEPLIISDPESYIKNQGLSEAKRVLGSIPENSVFGNSIFNSLAQKYMYQGSDISEQLANLSKSELPGIIRNNFCDDATLTSYAMEDIGAAGGEISNSDLVARKNELYEYACTGDINDPEVQARLIDLNEQRPSIGGWDSWLAVTGGENDYTRIAKGDILVANEVAKSEELGLREIYDGAGPISQTKCIAEAAAQEGEIAECLKRVTLSPGDVVSGSVVEAVTAGVNRLANIQGEGALTSLLTSLATQYIISGINEAFTSSSDGSNSTTVTINTRPPTQDLAYDSARKNELVEPMERQFTYYTASLNDLETTDNNYMADLAVYEAKVDQALGCYNSLLSDNLVSESDSNLALLRSRKSQVTSTKNSLQAELAKITEARALLADTKNKIANSVSTQEINGYFDVYMSTIASRGLPQIQTVATRKGEYTRNKADTRDDKQVSNAYNQCLQIQQSVNSNNGNGA